MAEREQRDMSGVLFKNDRKEKDTHADYRGNCTINGVNYWMSAWIKEGAKGKFMSFSFKPKDAPAAKPAAPSNQPPPDNDDVPF